MSFSRYLVPGVRLKSLYYASMPRSVKKPAIYQKSRSQWLLSFVNVIVVGSCESIQQSTGAQRCRNTCPEFTCGSRFPRDLAQTSLLCLSCVHNEACQSNVTSFTKGGDTSYQHLLTPHLYTRHHLTSFYATLTLHHTRKYRYTKAITSTATPRVIVKHHHNLKHLPSTTPQP